MISTKVYEAAKLAFEKELDTRLKLSVAIDAALSHACTVQSDEESAVLAERERCAKIAWKFADEMEERGLMAKNEQYGVLCADKRQFAIDIATAIRAVLPQQQEGE